MKVQPRQLLSVLALSFALMAGSGCMGTGAWAYVYPTVARTPVGSTGTNNGHDSRLSD